MKLYKDRGVNPASGCLPAVLQLVLLLPMYQVFTQGLKAPDISSMLHPFGIQVVNAAVPEPGRPLLALYRPQHPLAGLAAQDRRRLHLARLPRRPALQPARDLPHGPCRPGPGPVAAGRRPRRVLQLVQTRMMMTAQQRPLAGHAAAAVPAAAGLLADLRRHPAGGPLHLLDHHHRLQHRPAVPDQRLRRAVPALRLDPGFRDGPQPRFPVTMPEPKPAYPDKDGDTTKTTKRSTKESAAGTIRPARRRSRRRGRRR